MLTCSDNVMNVQDFDDILKVLDKDRKIKSFKAYEYTDTDGCRKIRIDDIKYVECVAKN